MLLSINDPSVDEFYISPHISWMSNSHGTRKIHKYKKYKKDTKAKLT